jgi:hypothetical protein
MSLFIFAGAVLMALGFVILWADVHPHPLMGHNPARPVHPSGPLLLSSGLIVAVVGLSRS